LLVAPGDIQALSGAIDRLIGDPQYADGLARAAEGHVRRHFSLSVMIDAYTRLYEDSLLGRI
jgi:glycosyltransferase involved in cell wall biosynthesis